MDKIINALPLYNFMKYCEESNLEKKIIDCGAGGKLPPLSLFYSFGYEVFGIDNSIDQIEAAERFAQENNMNLNIELSDMKNIPKNDNSYSFLYSYNTSVHIPKSEFSEAISEFHRVLKPNGLVFVNFLSYDCDTYGMGKRISDGVYAPFDDDTLFVHYSIRELENILSKFEVIYYEEKLISRKFEGKVIKSGFYDYILKKSLK
jgi:2-polyprenyl-3-methyl-5-hydroxy-6-metoxy-1,4-benzoquinol methylase